MSDEHYREYTNERVIGHRVSAEPHVNEWLSETGERLGIAPREYVVITEGDVDWDSTHSVRLSLKELREIAEMFCVGDERSESSVQERSGTERQHVEDDE